MHQAPDCDIRRTSFISMPSVHATGMPAKKCPVCGVSVKVENLERHIRNQHPHEDVSLESALSAEERQEVERRRAAKAPLFTQKGLRLVAVVAVILVAVVLLIALNPFNAEGPGVGQVAPDFTLSATTGGTFTLSAYRGTPVLLEFMDVDCPACQVEAQDGLSPLFTTYGASVRFLSVDVNFVGAPDTVARIEAFRAQYNTPWLYGLDSARTIQGAYGVRSTPTTFVLDRNGVVLNVFVGIAGYATLAQALDAALSS